jgi:predicted pyridoxine 5'-phosphate oxidase superfamily flavin-nucleotide-binding protein
MTLTEEIINTLGKKIFITVATCNLKGQPNAAPKLYLKYQDEAIYLVDYSFGKTWENLKINARASISAMNSDHLTGYRINGSVELIENTPFYDEVMKELKEKEISLSVERIIEGIHRGKRHESFELEIPKRFVIYKLNVEEMAEIGPSGKVIRKKRS